MKKNFKIYLIFLCIFSLGYSVEPAAMLLPINATLEKGKRVQLVVEIPEKFKCLQDIKNTFTEFIPENENGQNWSEIITVSTEIGKKYNAQDFIDYFKKSFPKVASEVKILSEISEKKDTYTVALLLILYVYKNRKELMFAKYYSGPFDCSGIQYTIALNDKITQELAAEKIKKFEENNTQLIEF